MEFSVKSGTPEKQRVACVVVGIFTSRKFSEAAQRIDQASEGFLTGIRRRGDLTGKAGQALLLHNVPNMLCERVLIIGCGKERDFDEQQYRNVNAAAAKFINDTGATEIISYLTELEIKGRDIHWNISHAVQAIYESLYRFDQLKSDRPEARRPLRKVTLAVPRRSDLAIGEQAAKEGTAIGLGVELAKNLGNLPGNICTPAYLADQGLELQKKYAIKTTILEESDMRELGMGSLLSVARGSREPAKLITMEYNGGPDDQAPVVLVGKGLTFDAGGISLKSAANMDEMKYDMCGGASVLGAMKAVAELKLPLNVVGVIPSSENLPDGAANKPGDIVTSMAGITIEILNTDAEGRLILCDALTYSEKFHPATVIDIATLTGACVVALGRPASGLLSNNDSLARELLAAGNAAYDRAWQLPLWDDYQKQLDSNFADIANVGGREAGTITAACFLSRFTKKLKWAHLDIAGTAWKQGKEKGATGRPVGLLVQYLIQQSRKQAKS